MDSLRAVSYLSPNLLWFYDEIGATFSRKIGLPVELRQSAHDSLDDPAFQNDEVDMAFVCGLPYTIWCRQHPDQFSILGAPVLENPRYADRPVYFADVIVKADSPYRHFEDLRDKTFCYNDPGSNSGYNLLRGWMLDAGLTTGFFGKTIATGGHQHSIDWIVQGQADCSAIDSVVLEEEIRLHPKLEQEIRICVSIGPSPMPPILVSNRVSRIVGNPKVIEQLQHVLLHPDDRLAAAMSQAKVRRFAVMYPEDYTTLGYLRDRAFTAGFGTIS